METDLRGRWVQDDKRIGAIAALATLTTDLALATLEGEDKESFIRLMRRRSAQAGGWSQHSVENGDYEAAMQYDGMEEVYEYAHKKASARIER